MDILVKALGALWQVVAVGLLIGAGLPALFALGIRALNPAGAVVAASTASTGSARPTAAGSTVAVICFAVCVLAVLFGIVVIVLGKQLFGV